MDCAKDKWLLCLLYAAAEVECYGSQDNGNQMFAYSKTAKVEWIERGKCYCKDLYLGT